MTAWWLLRPLDEAAVAYLEWRWPAPPSPHVYQPTPFEQSCADYIVTDQHCGVVLSDTPGRGAAFLTRERVH